MVEGQCDDVMVEGQGDDVMVEGQGDDVMVEGQGDDVIGRDWWHSLLLSWQLRRLGLCRAGSLAARAIGSSPFQVFLVV